MQIRLLAALLLAFTLASGSLLAQASKPAAKPDFKPSAEVLKDTTKSSGWLTLHHNKKTDALFLEIPKSRLNKEFLVATSVSSGGQFTGFQWGHQLLKWEMQGKNVLLIAPEVRHLRKSGTVKDVIKRTYPDTILRVLPIKAKTPKGDPIVDLGALLKSDLAGVGRVLGGSVKADLSRFGSIKNFPSNTEIPVDLAVMSGASGERGTVHYSISKIPSTGYKSRVSDDRIGYFMTVQRDWTAKHDEDTTFLRYINRWHLEKRDSSLELSPPKEPIVFYIEKTVPVALRRYVKEGILEWNKAFEKCGFLDAIEVRQQTDTQFNDLDPEDARYNFFRWIVSGRAFAMGPSRVNPRTGQILDADIIMDDSFVRYFVADYEPHSSKGMTPYEEHDPVLNKFLEQNPEWRVEGRSDRMRTERDEAWTGVRSPEHSIGPDSLTGNHQCQAAEGMVHQVNLMRASLAAKGKKGLPFEFLGQILREVVMHEVGHTLGLRHNFKASAWLSMDEVMKAKGDSVATVASVMDYSGAVFATKEAEQGNYMTTTIGPYDYWAIDYGYSTVGEPYKSEAEMLAAICKRSGEPGHAYATDEDTSWLGPDPLINRYDMSSDNIAFAKQQLAVTRELLGNIEEWAVEDGESYSKLRSAFSMLIGEYGRVGSFVGRYVGGQFVSRSHRGDVGAEGVVLDAPLTVVPAAKQREAVDFLCSTVFADETWKFDPALLAKLAAGRYSHWSSDDYSSSLDYDIHDRIERLQGNAMMMIMNPVSISRLYDSGSKVAAGTDIYTVPEHFEKLASSIWSELDDAPDGKKDYISSVRRGLQRMQLRLLTNLSLQRPGRDVPADVNALAMMNLQQLGEKINKVLGSRAASKLDAFSKAHLSDCSRRIKAATEASFDLDR